MSNTNLLEEMLEGVKAEWRTLEDIGEVRMCKRIFKNQTSDVGDIPFYKIGTFGKEPNAFITRELFEEYKAKYSYPKAGEVLISASGTIGRAVIFDGQDAYFQDSNIVWIENDERLMLNKYLFYYYQIADWNPSDGGVIKRLYNNNLKKVKILIPSPENPEKSLEIQAEIVRVLDTFTELTAELMAELTAELTARKKQYAYYRDQLLTFEEEEVEWKTLGEVAKKITSGGTPKTSVSEYWEKGTIPWMSSGEVNLETVYKTEKFISEAGLKNSSAKFVSKNSIVIALAGQGKTRGKVARTRIDLTTNQSLASLTFDENHINSDYVFHFLKTQYDNLRQISSGGGNRGGLNLQMISEYKLPVPSLIEQARIVSILDKFDALTNAISEGLPREIELRQKQYEYYREQLLSFPKGASEA